MERQDTKQEWHRQPLRMLRAGCTIVLCLAGTVACLQDTSEERVAVVLPSPTPSSRDVRTPGARATRPAVPSPTFVPTVTPPSQPTPVEAQPAQGQVVYPGEEGVNLRAEPNQQIIAALLKDSLVTIRGPARDDGGFRWWPVTVEPGWMAEGPRDTTQERWLLPAGSTRIEPGQQAQVVYPGKDGLNVRRSPGPDGEKVATLLQGSQVMVIGGPEDIDGMIWWQVQVAQGWLSEGATDPAQPRWIVMRP